MHLTNRVSMSESLPTFQIPLLEVSAFPRSSLLLMQVPTVLAIEYCRQIAKEILYLAKQAYLHESLKTSAPIKVCSCVKVRPLCDINTTTCTGPLKSVQQLARLSSADRLPCIKQYES